MAPLWPSLGKKPDFNHCHVDVNGSKDIYYIFLGRAFYLKYCGVKVAFEGCHR